MRNGFLELLEQIEAPSGWLSHFIPARQTHLNFWQRVRVTFEELGPTFVKFGQVISSRPDVLPQPLIDELKTLRTNVKPMPWEAMGPILRSELEGEISDFFDDFDTTPIASGSVGQIYRAKLKGTGTPVAVKLQRPGIRKEIKADLEIIGWFARQMHQKISELQAYDLPAVVEETGFGMLRELDFTIEARNANAFTASNGYPDKVFAPKVYEQFTTHRLLVTEWIEGTTPDKVTRDPETASALAKLGGCSVFDQIFIQGFFHADPHTGNLLITADNRICLIDWGLAGQLTRAMRYFLADLFGAVAQRDAEKVVQITLAAVGGRTRIDPTKLEKEIRFVLHKHTDGDTSKSFPIGRVMVDLLYVFGSNGVKLARDYSLLTKAVISIEESGLTLDPEFDSRDIAKPFLEKLRWERWNPSTVLRQLYWSAQGTVVGLRDLPNAIQRLTRRLEEGDLAINLQHQGLDGLRSTLDSVANRLVLAIIVAALLVGSSLIIRSASHQTLWQFPNWLGVVGYHIAFVFTLWLIYDIIRHGRHR